MGTGVATLHGWGGVRGVMFHVEHLPRNLLIFNGLHEFTNVNKYTKVNRCCWLLKIFAETFTWLHEFTNVNKYTKVNRCCWLLKIFAETFTWLHVDC